MHYRDFQMYVTRKKTLFSNLKMSLKESPEGDNIDTDRSINFGRVIRERFLGNEILPKDEG